VNGKLLKNLYGVPETSNFSIYWVREKVPCHWYRNEGGHISR
jgi:hypothetical protein